jgi:glucoamylase
MSKDGQGAVIDHQPVAAKSADWCRVGFAAIAFFAMCCEVRSGAAEEAPGVPGIASAWTTGAKEGLGTSTTIDSKIWYTIQQGILGEVYYPKVDVPNVQDLQFIVTDGSTFVDLERDATAHKVILLDKQALTYRQVNTKADLYRITKTYVTDVARPTLLIETRFQALSGGPYQLYVLYNPSLRNSGMGDTAATSGNALVASDGDVASALLSSSGFVKTSNGYSGTPSDGYQDLRTHGSLNSQFDSASAPGNVVQVGQVSVGSDTTFTLALSFGSSRSEAFASAEASLAIPFAEQRATYEGGWHSYLAPLTIPKSVAASDDLRTQYHVAVMTLKAHEDKTFRGANVASLTIPWGNLVNADECCVAGYHHVWARDLYQVATALLAAGDVGAANRSLDYLLDKQQIKAPTIDGGGRLLDPGAFPRFSELDGITDRGCCEQFDQDAFPLVLAWQLNRTDAATWEKLKLTADHILAKGPATPAERWEEQDGFSPSTIAAEIAGLVCAADIARKNSDAGRAQNYLAKADEWQEEVENWTFTTTGTFGNHHYYERIDHDGNPNDLFQRTFRGPSGNEQFWEKDVVDAGFLELVRLGVKPADDPKVAEALALVDKTIRVATPNGDMFYRYNHDSYGENANSGNGWTNTNGDKGRLWAILTGERGEYELANGRSAAIFLQTMAKAANDGFMIPEQVWDGPDEFGFVFGKGTGSATPLAWSMAEFVRLALSIDAGKPVETPEIVTTRYGR